MDDKYYAKAELKREGKKLTGIASTEAEDRHGEIVQISGWDLKNAKDNCPLLWAHKHDEPAIGTVDRLWVSRAKESGSKAKLMFEAFISDATERGRAIKQLVEEGVLKAFSVGFRGLEMDDNKFTKQELLEISIVNVPANPDALMLAYKNLSSSGISDATMRELEIPVDFIKQIEDLEVRIKSLEDKAKEGDTSASQVEKQVVSQLTVLKGMSRKADELILSEKRGGMPKGSRITAYKVLKRSSDLLISSTKRNGTTKRTT